MMWGFLTAAITTFIGYLIFIPRFGYYGAAAMTVFSEVLIMIWTWVLVYKTIRFSPSFNKLFKMILASIVMCLIIYPLRDLPVLLVMLISVAVYFPVLYLLGGLKISTIKELFRI